MMISRYVSTIALALSTVSSSAFSVSPRQTNGSSNSPHFDSVSRYIDSLSEELWPINTEIHDNPELGYQEVKAHKLLTDYFEGREGWNVTRSAYNISTAFIAIFEGNEDGPIVSFNAEYDALPGIGHACGHNLIATASVSGALATAEVMKAQNLSGRVILFGTPAEESLGGKIKLLEAGAFREHKIDISLISHPMASGDSPYMITTSTDRLDVEYYGKEAHAAASSWEGINAQDAILLANSGLSLLRQQIRTTDRVHGFIQSGGSTINVIPAKASGSYQVRSRDNEELETLMQRVKSCFEAGALGTGAELNLTVRPYGYSNMVSNDVLARRYTNWITHFDGIEVPEEAVDKLREPSASTDQGDVSHDFPSISPPFGITFENGTAPPTGPHTAPFEVAAGSRKAFDKALLVGKGLAGVAVDVLTVDGLLDEIKAEFKSTQSKLRKRQRA